MRAVFKRIISSVLAAAMIIQAAVMYNVPKVTVQAAVGHQNHKMCVDSVCGDTSIAGDNICNHGEETWTAWSYTTSNRKKTYKTNGTYYLSGDVTLDSSVNPINIQKDETLTLCLNGHTITKGVEGESLFTVRDGGTLNLCDCQGGGRLTGATKFANVGAVTAYGAFNMYGGAITGNEAGTTSSTPGGLFIANYPTSAFNMYGGTISGNKGTRGGGVRCCSNLNLYAGTISDNEASEGGGGVSFDAYSGTIFNMYGGTISGNNVSGTNRTGGGISTNGGEFNLYAGSVSGNKADSGGGIYTPSCVVNLRGGEIKGNAATNSFGGGIFAQNSANINVYSGAVSGNTAARYGGGIYFDHGKITLDGRVNISGNTRDGGSADNVYLNGSVVTVGESFDTASVVGIHKSSTASITCSYTEKIAENVSTDISAGFTSDTEDAHIEYTGSELKLMGNHRYPDTYSRDEDKHWKVCTICGNIKDEAEHVYENGECVCGAMAPGAVTLYVNGGSGGTALSSYTHGTKVELPTDWVKTGYTFAGWYDNAGCTGTAVTEISAAAFGDKEYWAKWTANTYTVTYSGLDGAVVSGNPAGYTIESNTITLNNPKKEGYIFTGWSGTGLSGEKNTIVTIQKGSTGDRVYMAHWTAAGYNVTLAGNGGSGTPLSAYTHGTKVDLPTDWTRAGYTFGGWYDNANCAGAEVKEISATATGNKEYWAKWMPNTYQVTFDHHGADGGDLTASQNVTYAGQYGTLPVPLKTGYNFQGWYTETDGQGTKVEANTTVTTADNHTLHAWWLDKTPPAKPVLQDGAALITGWTNTQTTIPLKTYDGVGVTELWVSIDGKTYTKANGFLGGTGIINYEYAVQSGKHTYQFMAKDAAGNTSAASDKFEVRLDQEPPVIGTLTYENMVHPNLWDWIIGKKGMVVHVPVTDTDGGADEITYTVTPDGGTAEVKTATVQDGEAEIPFSADFKGTISIVCTDKAGNTSASVTVGADSGATGIIIEDHAPEITFEAQNAELAQPGEYKKAPDITVTVTDNKDNAVSAGIASVIYQIGSGDEKAVDHNYTAGMVLNDSFTIPADEISAGGIPADGAVISVTATDNAGNSVTETYTVKVHTHSETLLPAKEATCTETGLTEGSYCSVCGYIIKAQTVVAALGHDFSGSYECDEKYHWKKCSRCEEIQLKEKHIYDYDTDPDCNVCGYERTINSSGEVSKDVEKDEKAPVTVLSTSKEELADIILTEEEKSQVENGSDIKFILNVKDAEDTVSSGDKSAVQEALSGDDETKGFAVGQYLDISLFKIIGENRSAISETARKLTIVIDVPDSLKSKDIGKPRTFAIIRVHDGVAETLEDLDDDADTITIETDRFSAYAIIYKQAGGGEDIQPTMTPAMTPSPVQTQAPTMMPTPIPTMAPTLTPGPTPDGGDKPDPTPEGSGKPSPTPGTGGQTKPTATPDGGGDVKPTSGPMSTPAATITPTPMQTPSPTLAPTSMPSQAPDGGKPSLTPGSGDKSVPSPTGKTEEASDKEKRKAELHSGLKAVWTGKKLQISWGRVSGADGYNVYVRYCGEDFGPNSLNQVKSGKKTKISIEKVNGRKLDTTRNFKLYIVAWQWKNGKKCNIARTLIVHIAGKDSAEYTNVRRIRLMKTSYTLKQGGTAKILPRSVLYDRHKKQLSAAHANEFRYLSSDEKVAVVTSGGKVRAKGPGSCTIYVFAKNGCKRKIKVWVKK